MKILKLRQMNEKLLKQIKALSTQLENSINKSRTTTKEITSDEKLKGSIKVIR